VTDDQRAQQLLEGLDRPRAPRPEFDRSLRAELFGAEAAARDVEPDVVVDLEPRAAEREQREHRRRPGQMIVAAAVVALLALGTLLAVTQLGSDDGDVATRTGSQIEQQASVACSRFNENAFATFGRQELLGPNREAAFRDRAKVQRAMTELTTALQAFPGVLRAAVISDPEVTRLLTQANVVSAATLEQLRLGAAIPRPRSMVAEIDVLLVDLQRRLIALGVTRCL
jgi:hypothetical protein